MNLEYKSRLCRLFNISPQKFDELYAAEPFRGIRINTLKCDADTVIKGLGIDRRPTPFYKESYYLPQDFKGIGNTPLHHCGAFYVQEPSATSVLSVLDVRPGERVLDLCAAPGGKSTGIAAALKGSGLLWSNEYIRRRASALLSNIERMGIANSVVSSLSADYLCSELCGFFDAVLVDAPCSGEGMWRHNDEVEKQWSADYVKSCAELQSSILDSAAMAVRGGGRLVYSTCTFSPEENEQNVAAFIKRHPEFELMPIAADFGMGGLSGEESVAARVRRIWIEQGGEGHFVALFKKRQEDVFVTATPLRESISTADKKTVEDFLAGSFKSLTEGILYEKNGLVYLVPEGTPEVRGDILRYGLLLGELRKGRLEPSHALFTTPAAVPLRSVELSPDDARLTAFLRGEEIAVPQTEGGYTAVTLCGIPLGFGKASGGRLTNRYPKGLRLL